MQKILGLAHKLQDALPFGSEGITSEEEYTQALAIADELTDDYDESNKILLDVLWPVIMKYEETSPEFSEFNAKIAKMRGPMNNKDD